MLAKIMLAPGQIGFHDALTNVHLTVSNPYAVVFPEMNTTYLKEAVKKGQIVLVCGTLTSIVNHKELNEKEEKELLKFLKQQKLKHPTLNQNVLYEKEQADKKNNAGTTGSESGNKDQDQNAGSSSSGSGTNKDSSTTTKPNESSKDNSESQTKNDSSTTIPSKDTSSGDTKNTSKDSSVDSSKDNTVKTQSATTSKKSVAFSFNKK